MYLHASSFADAEAIEDLGQDVAGRARPVSSSIACCARMRSATRNSSGMPPGVSSIGVASVGDVLQRVAQLRALPLVGDEHVIRVAHPRSRRASRSASAGTPVPCDADTVNCAPCSIVAPRRRQIALVGHHDPALRRRGREHAAIGLADRPRTIEHDDDQVGVVADGDGARECPPPRPRRRRSHAGGVDELSAPRRRARARSRDRASCRRSA